jgi:hypothetical protein
MVFAQPGKNDLNTLNWLLGEWTRTNVKIDQVATEQWKKISATEWHGTGVSIRKGDTTFVEHLKIIVQNDTLFYVADVAENKQPVYFTFTSISTYGFTAENPNHDFPKKIEYWLKDEKLHAITSGNAKAIDFYFKKK